MPLKPEYQFIGVVDVTALLAQLAACPEVWNLNPFRQVSGGAHENSRDVIIRSNPINIAKNTATELITAPHLSEWFEAVTVLPSAKAIAMELMTALGGENLGAVLIYEVPPGCSVEMHIDTGWHPEFYDKFNICLETNEDSAMVFEKTLLRQKVGDIHEFRNDILHGSVNMGTTNHRVLIVCLRRDRGTRIEANPTIPAQQNGVKICH